MDQVLGAAVGTVVAILLVVGVIRLLRRRTATSDHFGAGGRSTVPSGTAGIVKTALAPSGVVTAAGEDWSARSRSGAEIASGASVTVMGQDGLTLIVEPASTPRRTQG
jgi:membrane protein implicated in regulation of membrane protease activity